MKQGFHNTQRQAGFSLIEVTLALMVVSFGLLGIFHLFPAGLRASADATAETRLGQFADEVFNQLYAEAAGKTTAATWAPVFSGSVDIDLVNSSGYPSGGNMGGLIPLNGTTVLAEYPAGSGEYLRCRCVTSIVHSRLARVEMHTTYGRAGGFENIFYTEVYYYGM
jgi:prepilin-type N-terminal cleavage/methylation domain-containing protein